MAAQPEQMFTEQACLQLAAGVKFLQECGRIFSDIWNEKWSLYTVQYIPSFWPVLCLVVECENKMGRDVGPWGTPSLRSNFLLFNFPVVKNFAVAGEISHSAPGAASAYDWWSIFHLDTPSGSNYPDRRCIDSDLNTCLFWAVQIAWANMCISKRQPSAASINQQE